MTLRPALLPALVAASLATSAIASAQATPSGPSGQHAVLAKLPPDSLERARRYAAWLFTARTDSLWANVDSIARIQFGSASVMDDIAADIAIRAGSEERLIEERWVNRLGKRQYWRTGKYSGADEPVILRLVILPSGKLAGMGVNPVSQAPPIDP
jgi:hypothetical protein